jgi:hypothetical protein
MQTEVDLIHTSPYLGRLRVVNQECNCFAERIPSGFDPGLWRLAFYSAVQAVHGIDRLTPFTLVSTNNATLHVALYTAGFAPIGRAFSVAAMSGGPSPTGGN